MHCEAMRDHWFFVSFEDFKYITESLDILAERSDSDELKNGLNIIASEVSKDFSFLEKSYKTIAEVSKEQLSNNLYMTGSATIFSLIMVIILAVCKKKIFQVRKLFISVH